MPTLFLENLSLGFSVPIDVFSRNFQDFDYMVRNLDILIIFV